jgi:hypothetical protein
MLDENVTYTNKQLPSHSFFSLTKAHYSSTGEYVRYYDYGEIETALWSRYNKHIFDCWDVLGANWDFYWRLCSVTAPSLDRLSMTAEYGMFCNICGELDPQQIPEDGLPRSIREVHAVTDSHCNKEGEEKLDLMKIYFMRVTDLVEYMRRQHHKEAVKDA